MADQYFKSREYTSGFVVHKIFDTGYVLNLVR
jgi:hypothetical protein